MSNADTIKALVDGLAPIARASAEDKALRELPVRELEAASARLEKAMPGWNFAILMVDTAGGFHALVRSSHETALDMAKRLCDAVKNRIEIEGRHAADNGDEGDDA